jgi:hypothetical protein
MAYPGITHCSECGKRLDWRLGRCESCVSKSEGKSTEQVGKYKLIDILNKIANGELKEGTKVITKDGEEFTYKRSDIDEEYHELLNEDCESLLTKYYIDLITDEVELIEPQEPKECEHEWEEYGMYNTKTKEDKHFRKCIKCDLEEEIEPTDNTKIEELKGNGRNGNFYTIHDWIVTIEDKLNEVIRYINKENNNE